MGKLYFTTCTQTYLMSGPSQPSQGVENTPGGTAAILAGASVAFVTS